MKLVMKYMTVAEQKFIEGAEKKEWVMAMIKATSDSLNFKIDYNVVSDMIDQICAASNNINVKGETAKTAEKAGV